MNKKVRLSAFLFLFTFSVAADISIPLAGVPLANPNIVNDIDTDGVEGPFVQGTNQKYSNDFSSSKESVALPDQGIDSGLETKTSELEQIESNGYKLPMSLKTGSSYQRLNNNELLSRFHEKGSRNFSFFYLNDNYDISDKAGIYQRTFDNNAPKSMRGGSLNISLDDFWTHDSVFVGWEVNVGIGLSKGNGSFTSGGVIAERSNTTFSLWSVPVDLGLVFEVPLGRWLKVGVSGGPSVMGLFQNRNDKENNEKGKRVRQASFGYYGTANFKVSMSHLVPLQSVRNFKAYEMTKMYLTFQLRFQEFSNFNDDLTITGTSFGLGMTFEYL